MLHPTNNKACVRYYYLPARNGNCAEVIVVLNSQNYNVNVPVWEEDIILEPFYTRPITSQEAEYCAGTETWKLFSDWQKLNADHLKNGVREHELNTLVKYKNNLPLAENMPENMVA